MHELIETATHNCQATKVFTATRFATDLSARAERQLASGRERSRTFMTDFASVQKHLTAITSAQTDFAKSSFEANKAYFDKLADVKSPDKFLELTTEYAKSAQKTFVAEATKIGELYTAFAKEAFTPFTSNFLPK